MGQVIISIVIIIIITIIISSNFLMINNYSSLGGCWLMYCYALNKKRTTSLIINSMSSWIMVNIAWVGTMDCILLFIRHYRIHRAH